MDLTQVLEATASPGKHQDTHQVPLPPYTSPSPFTLTVDTQVIQGAQQQLENAAQTNLVGSPPSSQATPNHTTAQITLSITHIVVSWVWLVRVSSSPLLVTFCTLTLTPGCFLDSASH